MNVSGADVSNAKRDDAGLILADVLRKIMSDIGCPDGLKALGYTTDDIPALVTGTMPQVKMMIVVIMLMIVWSPESYLRHN